MVFPFKLCAYTFIHYKFYKRSIYSAMYLNLKSNNNFDNVKNDKVLRAHAIKKPNPHSCTSD